MSKYGSFWGISAYEFKADSKRKTTYVLLGIIITVTLGIGFFYPVAIGKSSISNKSIFWVYILLLLSNGFISGFFPMLLGTFISIDSICGEFEKGTMSLILAQPVKRFAIFFGKFFEKIVLMLGTSALLVVIALLISQFYVAQQSHIQFILLVLLSFFIMTIFFTSLTFFLGSIFNSTAILIGIVLAVFLGVQIGISLLSYNIGFSLWMVFVPLSGVNFVFPSLYNYILNPVGKMNMNIGAITQKAFLINTSELLFYSILSVLIWSIIFFVLGYFIFKRKEVKG